MKNLIIILILIAVVVVGYVLFSGNTNNFPAWQTETKDVKVEETAGFQQTFKITDPSQIYPEMP